MFAAIQSYFKNEQREKNSDEILVWLMREIIRRTAMWLKCKEKPNNVAFKRVIMLDCKAFLIASRIKNVESRHLNNQNNNHSFVKRN